MKSPLELAQSQLDAYNNRDIDAFMENYSVDCEVYDQSSGAIQLKGHEAMRARYSKLFSDYPMLNAKVINRMELGNFVIDQEEVMRSPNEHIKAIAIYECIDGLIRKVWFIR